MPFAILEKGNRAKVLEHIATLKEPGPGDKPAADQSQADLLKSIIASEVNALPKEFSGVLVIAECRVSGNKREMVVQTVGEEGHY